MCEVQEANIILEVKDIVSGYGKMEILHGVSLTAEESKTTGIIGPNGAGKSTLLKTIFGYLRPKNGRVMLDGENITGLGPELILKKGVSYIAQSRALFPKMTVFENLKMGVYIVKDRERVRKSIEEAYERYPMLEERKNQIAGTLSGGQQRILELARSLMLSPKVVLIDEPSLGLAPKLINEFYREIEKLRTQKRAVLLVEQNVRKALEVSDYIFVLELGKNTFEGKPKEILDSDKLKGLYLGG